jgi:hypothetical protein
MYGQRPGIGADRQAGDLPIGAQGCVDQRAALGGASGPRLADITKVAKLPADFKAAVGDETFFQKKSIAVEIKTSQRFGKLRVLSAI